MTSRIVLQREVNVPEIFFKNEERLAAFPRRIEFDGREYVFSDGLRHMVNRGRRQIQVFDMTDGTRDFRLQLDTARSSWILVDMTA